MGQAKAGSGHHSEERKENDLKIEQKDILDVLKWFNNPDNMKGTDTVAWIPRRVLAAAIGEIRNLREDLEYYTSESSTEVEVETK